MRGRVMCIPSRIREKNWNRLMKFMRRKRRRCFLQWSRRKPMILKKIKNISIGSKEQRLWSKRYSNSSYNQGRKILPNEFLITFPMFSIKTNLSISKSNNLKSKFIHIPTLLVNHLRLSNKKIKSFGMWNKQKNKPSKMLSKSSFS